MEFTTECLICHYLYSRSSGIESRPLELIGDPDDAKRPSSGVPVLSQGGIEEAAGAAQQAANRQRHKASSQPKWVVGASRICSNPPAGALVLVQCSCACTQWSSNWYLPTQVT